MSTSTGNVKISQLDALNTIDNGSKLIFPVSKDGGNAGAPDWASYSVNANLLSDFIGKHLQITNTGGLKDKVTNLTTKLNETTGKYETLEEYLGKYTTVTNKSLGNVTTNYYITTSGQKQSNGSYSISGVISLKQGNLYLFNAKYNGAPDVSTYNPNPKLSLISKVSTHTHSKGTDTVYEPLSTLYQTNGSPNFHGYVVFFATEDMDVVISGDKRAIVSGNNLREVKYGAFIEAASRLLTVNGELMKVLVEAIVKNRKDIDTINENLNSFGDIHVNSIDCDDYPSVQGEPMVVVKNRRPGGDANTAAAGTHGPDVPNRIGQIWVDTKGGKAYIAVKLGSTGTDSWKLITTT